MKKSTIELLIRIAKCSDVWRKEIENELPKLFVKEELEVGKWYNAGCRYLVCIKEDKGANSIVYGFSYKEWYSSKSFNIRGIYELTPATDKEVEQALIKEAKKRGFKEGVKHNGIERIDERGEKFKGSAGYCRTEFIYNNYTKETVLLSGGFGIFSNGKWAEIIKETITKADAESELGKTIID